MSTNKELFLHLVKVLGYLNFGLFILGFFNSKGGGDTVVLFLSASLILATAVTLVYIFGFKYLHLAGKRMDYWFWFRPYVWLIVFFVFLVISIASIGHFGNANS